MNLQPLQPDRFVWRWSSSRAYSVSSTYWAFFAGSTRLLGAKELWRTKAPPRVKLFFWLALHHRLWTTDRRKQHGLQDDNACALCDQALETACHLFLGCVFSRQVWHALLEPIHLVALLPDRVQELDKWWIQQRGLIDLASRPLFDSLLLLVAWTIWKERNCRLLGRRPSLVLDVVRVVIKEGEDWALAGFAPLAALHLYWSQHLFVM